MDGARINSFCQLPFLISCISYFSTCLYGEPLFYLETTFRSAIPLCQNAKIISLPKCQKSLVLYFKRQRNRAYNQPLSLLVVGPIFQFMVYFSIYGINPNDLPVFQNKLLALGRSGIFYGGLGPCYPNIVTEMGTFRGAIMP